MRRFILPVFLFAAGVLPGAWLATHFAQPIDEALSSTKPDSELRWVPANDPPTEERIISSMLSAVTTPGAFQRAYLLRESLARLDSKQLAMAFERALLVGDREKRKALLVAVLTRWAAVNPVEARAAVAPFLARIKAAGVILDTVEVAVGKAWAQAFPVDALQQAMASPGSAWSALTAPAALEVLTSGDPMKALTTVREFPASRLQAILAEGILTRLADQDPALAEANLDAIHDERTRTDLHITVLKGLASHAPQMALDRVAQSLVTAEDNTAIRRLVTEVIRQAASSDPTATLANVARLPEAFRADAQGAALAGWAGKDPISALDWAITHDVDLSKAGARIYVAGFGAGGSQTLISIALDTDREKTTAWILEQPEVNLRNRDNLLLSSLPGATQEQQVEIFNQLGPAAQAKGVANMVSRLGTESVTAAETWVRDLQRDDLRFSAIHELALVQARNGSTPEAITEAWPAGTERDSALGGLTYYFAMENPTHATAVANQISNPRKRALALINLAYTWHDSDKAGARTWVSTTEDFSADEKRVILRNFDEQ